MGYKEHCVLWACWKNRRYDEIWWTSDRNRDLTPSCSLQHMSCKDLSVLDECVFVFICPSVFTRIEMSDSFDLV